MSKPESQKAADVQEGIDIKKVTFDENGEVAGLDDEALKGIAGGLQNAADVNFGCDNRC